MSSLEDGGRALPSPDPTQRRLPPLNLRLDSSQIGRTSLDRKVGPPLVMERVRSIQLPILHPMQALEYGYTSHGEGVGNFQSPSTRYSFRTVTVLVVVVTVTSTTVVS